MRPATNRAIAFLLAGWNLSQTRWHRVPLLRIPLFNIIKMCCTFWMIQFLFIFNAFFWCFKWWLHIGGNKMKNSPTFYAFGIFFYNNYCHFASSTDTVGCLGWKRFNHGNICIDAQIFIMHGLPTVTSLANLNILAFGLCMVSRCRHFLRQWRWTDVKDLLAM